jgi:hypothetical protein
VHCRYPLISATTHPPPSEITDPFIPATIHHPPLTLGNHSLLCPAHPLMSLHSLSVLWLLLLFWKSAKGIRKEGHTLERYMCDVTPGFHVPRAPKWQANYGKLFW